VVLCPDVPVLDLALMVRALALSATAILPYRADLDPVARDVLAAAVGAEWSWCPATGRLVATGHASARAPDERVPAAWLVKTSGSEGAPKIVMLTPGQVQASALAVNQRLGLRASDAWLCCLRASHIGGLSILSRCAAAGATALLHDGFDVDTVARDLARGAVTHLSLVPPMLHRLLAAGVSAPPSLRVVLIGGQALSPALAERAIDAGWPLYLTYGMTETASQIATATRPLECPPVDGEVGPLLPGVCVRMRGSGATPTRLRVHGPMVMAGYATPERTPGHGLDHGWFETSDLAALGSDRELSILGRADDLLVIGGTNVSVARVASVVREAPGVSDALVVALDDTVWGHRLVALYCGDRLEADLARWCEARLCGPERPRQFTRLPALPLLDSGKHDRRAARALACAAGVEC
jgi:O-succinylbenzoic acid--CoA ligase